MKKAQVSIYIAFIIASILIIILAALFAPMGVEFTSQMYLAGEGIFLNTNSSIAEIQDTEVRTAIYDVISEAKEETTTNIEVLGDIYKYGWIIVIVLSALVVFLFTRRLNEIQGGFV